MSSVKRCDACGSIGESPYDGWLKVESFARHEVENDQPNPFRIGPNMVPVLFFEVCGHACLPALAFEHAAEFAG